MFKQYRVTVVILIHDHDSDYDEEEDDHGDQVGFVLLTTSL